MMKVIVISHAMVQDASRARWRHLAERHPVYVTLLVPSHWESIDFGELVTWDLQPVYEERFHVLPLPVTNARQGTKYFLKSMDAGLRRIQPDVIYTVHEENSRVLRQMILYRRLWAPHAKLVFFSTNNLGIPQTHGRSSRCWRRVCTGTDMAIVGSSEVKQVFQLAGYRKPVLVQTEIGIDERVFRPSDVVQDAVRARLGLKGFVIGYAGRIVAAKGLHDLVNALEELQGNWSLLLVGDGDLRSEILAHAGSKGWNVNCTGRVDIDEMPNYYPAMDCLVLPSRTTHDWKEQFGLVLAQAMACRVPVIGSSSGAIPEVIDDAGMIFPEGNVSALRNCLGRLMEDEGLRQDLAQRGYERAMAKYSATGLADETFQVFQRLINESLPDLAKA